MFYLLKRIDEKQCTIGERCMVLADFSGIPAGTKGIITEIYEEGVMVTWELDGVTSDFIREKISKGDEFMACHGWSNDGFSREELEYLAFETSKHPRILEKRKHGPESGCEVEFCPECRKMDDEIINEE